MTWCNDSHELDHTSLQIIADSEKDDVSILRQTRALTCPSCGHIFELRDSTAAGIQDLPGLPAGVKFDPSDTEILEHLEAKVSTTSNYRLHPLIHEFIPTLDGENGICSTHPEGLPGVSKDGQVRHFFHRPSKAYTTGTRKRRKVHTDLDGSETRWHKTGKTRPVFVNKTLKGFKKILVLYTNYGRKRKPEKTNWVMHQYHLGNNEEERDGELVVSKVFYQTQPRQCGSSIMKEDTIISKKSKMGNINNIGHEMQQYNNKGSSNIMDDHVMVLKNGGAQPNFLDYYHHPSPTQFMSYGGAIGGGGGSGSQNISRENQMMPSLVVQGDVSSFIHSSSHHFKQGEA